MIFINLINNKKIGSMILDYFQNDKEFFITMENLTGNWSNLVSFIRQK